MPVFVENRSKIQNFQKMAPGGLLFMMILEAKILKMEKIKLMSILTAADEIWHLFASHISRSVRHFTTGCIF